MQRNLIKNKALLCPEDEAAQNDEETWSFARWSNCSGLFKRDKEYWVQKQWSSMVFMTAVTSSLSKALDWHSKVCASRCVWRVGRLWLSPLLSLRWRSCCWFVALTCCAWGLDHSDLSRCRSSLVGVPVDGSAQQSNCVCCVQR